MDIHHGDTGQPREDPGQTERRRVRTRITESVVIVNGIAGATAEKATRRPYHEQEAVIGPTRSLWMLWRQLKNLTGQQLPSLAWRALAAFRRQKRTVQKASRQARRSWVDGMLSKAAEAGRHNNTKGVYDVVRRLAPKAPCKRIQIRDIHGAFLMPLQELEELRSYYQALFQQHPPLEQEVPASGQIFTIEVCSALQHVPAHKAAPKGCAPGILWKVGARVIAFGHTWAKSLTQTQWPFNHTGRTPSFLFW